MGKKSANLSVIDQGMLIEGTLSCKGELLIRGTVKGELTGELITIDKGGLVDANVNAESITVGGVFKGTVEVRNRLAVLSTGTCEGDVKCKDLVVEPGGVLNGRVTHIRPKEIPVEKKMLPRFKK